MTNNSYIKNKIMITIGYCTREHNENQTNHLIKMCGLPINKVEIIEIVNLGNRSLSECYNEILFKAKNDIVVFLHDDVIIETNRFADKILKHFKHNPEYGILGVAGTRILKTGQWWDMGSKS